MNSKEVDSISNIQSVPYLVAKNRGREFLGDENYT